MSEFGDDMAALERSVSQASVYRKPGLEEEEDEEEDPPEKDYRRNTKKVEIETRSRIPGEWPTERPISPLLPMVHKTRSRGWGEEWTHVGHDGIQTADTKDSDSAVSIARSGSDNSSGYARSYTRSSSDFARSSPIYASTSDRDFSSKNRISKRQPRPRIVTPSRSSSKLSKRSPLSTMRYVERLCHQLCFN